MTLQEYAKVRKLLEDAERHIAQAEGADGQCKKQLREHGCRDFDEARTLVQQLREGAAAMEAKVKSGMKEIEDKHGEKLQ